MAELVRSAGWKQSQRNRDKYAMDKLVYWVKAAIFSPMMLEIWPDECLWQDYSNQGMYRGGGGLGVGEYSQYSGC